MQGHVWSCTVALFPGLRGVCQWFDRHQNALVRCLFIFGVELTTPGSLCVPQHKNLIVLVFIFECTIQSNSKTINFRTHDVYLNIFFLFWCGEFNPEVNPRILDYKVCSPTGDMEICLLWMLRVVQLEATATGRSLDHESLPNVCHWVRLGGTISL